MVRCKLAQKSKWGFTVSIELFMDKSNVIKKKKSLDYGKTFLVSSVHFSMWKISTVIQCNVFNVFRVFLKNIRFLHLDHDP